MTRNGDQYPEPKIDLYPLVRCKYCGMLTGARFDKCGWCMQKKLGVAGM